MSVPGAIDILNYASSRRILTHGRLGAALAEAGAERLRNLQQLDFLRVNDETVMIREQGTTASKELAGKKSRRVTALFCWSATT